MEEGNKKKEEKEEKNKWEGQGRDGWMVKGRRDCIEFV